MAGPWSMYAGPGKPVLAEKILENNRLNRPLREGRVERYAKDMKKGRWMMNGETVKLTEAGDLLDGQHRLFAVIEAGVTVPMLVVEGLDEGVMPTIDTGAVRSFADVLAIRGGKNTHVVASVLRWLYWFQMGDARPKGAMSVAISHPELMQFSSQHFPDAAERVSEVTTYKRAKRFLAPSILGFVYVLAFRHDPVKAGSWLGLLDSGADVDEQHPVYLLRERMMANRLNTAKLGPTAIAALVVKGWNAYATGARPKLLRWSSEVEQFPIPVGYALAPKRRTARKQK